MPQSPSTGVPNAIPTNVGTMFNKGIEAAVSAQIIRGKNFSWTSSFNITKQERSNGAGSGPDRSIVGDLRA